VESDDFPNIVVASPLNPKEILTNYNSDKDIFILVRSERDPVPYTKKDGSPGYYQPLIPGEKLQPFSKHGYVFVTKKKDFDVNGQDVYSGTQVRNMYLNTDDTGRKSIVAQLYPKSKQQKKIKQILDTYIGTEFVPPAKNLKENLVRLIQQVRPLLKEANAEQKIKLLKLIKEAHSGALMEGSLNEDPVTQFASKAHDVWRKNFDPTGTKERIKKNSDGSEGNINVPFEKLHPDWKKENLAAGQAAMIAVNKFPRDIEQAAEYIHNEWMKRNPLADYNAAQHVPYDQLPEDEKEKDRVHVRTMMSLSGQQGMTESKSLTKIVKIVKGPDAGKTGWIREIKHGAFKGAPKT
ncbi:MAG: hypothetical protein EBU33_10780, partial [Sphingobacteriia bacterium]|nr:hypothetical protein [Sphingobacteriia bacterium]